MKRIISRDSTQPRYKQRKRGLISIYENIRHGTSSLVDFGSIDPQHHPLSAGLGRPNLTANGVSCLPQTTAFPPGRKPPCINNTQVSNAMSNRSDRFRLPRLYLLFSELFEDARATRAIPTATAAPAIINHVSGRCFLLSKPSPRKFNSSE